MPDQAQDSTRMTTVRRLVEGVSKGLALKLVAGAAGLERTIDSPRIQKLGLALAGYRDYLHSGRVQFVGRTETGYLSRLGTDESAAALEGVFSRSPCCIVVTGGLAAPHPLGDLADRQEVPLLTTEAVSSKAIAQVTGFLERELAPTMTIHGVLMEIFGLGVLLLGESGIGKSESALDLIRRGHRLVSDDMVRIQRVRPSELIGSGSSDFPFLMELRGLGFLNIQDLFGVSAVRRRHAIHLVVHLRRWQEANPKDRLGLEEEEELLLDVALPRITLPVAPGRNLATLVELAVRLQLLKEQGVNASRQFVEDLDRRVRDLGEDLWQAGAERDQ